MTYPGFIIFFLTGLAVIFERLNNLPNQHSMRYFYHCLLQFLFAAVLLLGSISLHAQTAAGAKAGKVILKFKTAAIAQLQRNATQLSVSNKPENFSTGIAKFDMIAKGFKATKMLRVFPNAGKMEAKQRKYAIDRWYELDIDQASSIQLALSSFRQVAEVEYVQPAYIIKSNAGVMRPFTGSVARPAGVDDPVNDPYYYLQWHYHNTGQVGGYAGADINLPEAWKINTGKPNVIVDVVDEGADYNHVDLAANMWINQAEANGLPGVDDDGNGFIDDVHGYNFADNMGTITPGDHGTHTSGTIAAVNNNGIGVAGVAGGTGIGDGARIMNSEIFGTAAGADGGATAAAIVYGANNGAVISQNSWGYTEPFIYDQVVLDAIDYFTKEAGRDGNGNQVGPMNGGVVIFAAGNNNISDPSYPAFFPEAIAVGATTCFDNKASYSNFGTWVDISAPGGDVTGAANQEVLSTMANNKYGYEAGTSMACPHVSGVAALIVSQFGKPGFTNEDLKNRLFATVDKFIAMDPSYNGLMGVGRLNAGRALQSDSALPPVTITNLSGISNNQNSIDLKWTAPSDPDNVNAQSYVLYYAKHTFDSTQKDTISKIFITPAQAAGIAETYNLSGLASSTNYYVRITAKDLWGNESALSNTAVVKTMDGPIVNVPSATITMNIDVSANPQQNKNFTLSNTGKGILNWTGSPVPVASSWALPAGFTDTLRYVDQDASYQYVGDDQTTPFSSATRFDVTTKSFSLTHVANFMRAQGIDKPIWISVYKGGTDPTKGVLLERELAAKPDDDGTLEITKLKGIYSFQPGEWFWVVYDFDGDYAFSQGFEGGADDALANYFLISSNNGSTWSTITSVYYPVRFHMYGLSNEKYFGGFVTMQPDSGVLASNLSSLINVNANATTVRNGTYNFNLQVKSNDLNNPSVGVPLIVNITGQKATLTSKEGILDCKNVFIGKDGDATLRLYNAGLATLNNFTFTTDNNVFQMVALPDSLYPGDSSIFTVRFTPLAGGLQQANFVIGSNGGTLKLSGIGVGIEPPVLSLSGVPVQITAKPDSTGKNTFTISNKDGHYPLSYSFPEIAAFEKAAKKGIMAQAVEPFGQYVWIDSKEPGGPLYHWDDIASTGNDITNQLAADVKGAKLFNLGFPMRVYGDTISQLYVTDYGLLSFNYPGAMSANSISFPIVGDGINGCISPLWYNDQVTAVTGNMKVYVKYAPGKFIVQYTNQEKFTGYFFEGTAFSLGKATYQVVLYADGKVEMNYKDVSNATWVRDALIGMENTSETKGFAVGDYQTVPVPWYATDTTTLWFVPVTPKFVTKVIPLNGAVAAGDSISIEVTAIAKNLIDSTYTNTLILTTNDPVNEKTDIPVLLTVTGVEGMMLKTDSLLFGNIFNNGTAKMDAVLLNTGTKPVKIISVAFDNPAFTSTMLPVSVPAQSEVRIPVTFNPTTITNYTAKLTVVTDNTTNPTFTVVLNGKSIAAPAMSYTFSGNQSEVLNIGDSVAATLKLTNTGTADLNMVFQHPQWIEIANAVKGFKNGLDSAQSYSVHKTMDSSQAAYEWVELNHGLGKTTAIDYFGTLFQEIKLPFDLPYFGQNLPVTLFKLAGRYLSCQSKSAINSTVYHSFSHCA